MRWLPSRGDLSLPFSLSRSDHRSHYVAGSGVVWPLELYEFLQAQNPQPRRFAAVEKVDACHCGCFQVPRFLTNFFPSLELRALRYPCNVFSAGSGVEESEAWRSLKPGVPPIHNLSPSREDCEAPIVSTITVGVPGCYSAKLVLTPPPPHQRRWRGRRRPQPLEYFLLQPRSPHRWARRMLLERAHAAAQRSR